MTTWLCLPPFEGSTRIISVDHISEFEIKADSQHIFNLYAYLGGTADGQFYSLMKTNNEGQIRSALTQLFIMKNNGDRSQSDVFIDIRNDGVFQKAGF